MVGTRKSKGELLPPKVKSRSNSGPNHYKNKPKEKIVRRTDTDHWLLGKYLNYEMSRTMLPLKSDIIKRFLSIKDWMSASELSQNQKSGIYKIIAKELEEIWMYSSIPYVDRKPMLARILKLITEFQEFSHNNIRDFNKNSVKIKAKAAVKFNVLFDLAKCPHFKKGHAKNIKG